MKLNIEKLTLSVGGARFELERPGNSNELLLRFPGTLQPESIPIGSQSVLLEIGVIELRLAADAVRALVAALPPELLP
jgi:hypothetical protein